MERIPLSNPAAARRIVRSTLNPLLPTDVVADAELLTSELVTNAIVHGDTPTPEVGVAGVPGHAHVEVADGGRGAPPEPLLDNDPTTPGGFGLQLVAELSDRWGVERTESGKTVWFEIDGESSDG